MTAVATLREAAEASTSRAKPPNALPPLCRGTHPPFGFSSPPDARSDARSLLASPFGRRLANASLSLTLR
ncbi:hypothetical protein I8752_19580 [Nostocaceae cyanobacterium CENA369]|uniref:Uncharacterized protein n=1 Tax=Dendronalium phyllosphericum CENA369 TaxID=1725256 RepID=A0A8J7I3N8_9NOST|nr:hypothetical protein [Dendronalium phyllosphericum]MBH8575176.1 hypothetical protein [Dendronalium phyllosphericum CENA369]